MAPQCSKHIWNHDLERTARSSTDRVSGGVPYTWGRAETTAYGRTYVADCDRPHSLSAVANYGLSHLIELGTTVRARSVIFKDGWQRIFDASDIREQVRDITRR